MKTLGVGLLGFGFMGRTHTFAHKAIPFYYNPAPVDCRLKVVCEATAGLAQAAQKTGGFERCTTDPRAAIEADDVDIIHVSTPNQHHYPALVMAIKAGKHIYVDKPVTATLEEAAELAKLLADYREIGQVALQYRFFPATIRARQLIDQGFLGPLTHFRAAYLHSGSVDPNKAVNWKSTAAAAGGVIRDLGSHVLDLLHYLIGPFHSVNCLSRIWATERPSLDKPGTTMKVDVEDAAIMLLRAANGTIGSVEVSKLATGTEDELRFELHGRHGAMRFNLMQPNYLEIYDRRLPEGDLGGSRGWQRIAAVQRYPDPGNKFPGPKFSLGWIRSHIHCLYAFLQCIAAQPPASTNAAPKPQVPQKAGQKDGRQHLYCTEGIEPHPSLAEGIHLQRVLEAVRESAARETWVELPQG